MTAGAETAWKSRYARRRAIERNWETGNAKTIIIPNVDAMVIQCHENHVFVDHPEEPLDYDPDHDMVSVFNAQGERAYSWHESNLVSCFGFDGSRIAVGMFNGQVSIRDWRSGALARTVDICEYEEVDCVRLRGDRLVASFFDGVKVFDADFAKPALAIDDNGKFEIDWEQSLILLASHQSGRIVAIDLANGERKWATENSNRIPVLTRSLPGPLCVEMVDGNTMFVDYTRADYSVRKLGSVPAALKSNRHFVKQGRRMATNGPAVLQLANREWISLPMPEEAPIQTCANCTLAWNYAGFLQGTRVVLWNYASV